MTLTVIIPTYRETDSIVRTLTSVFDALKQAELLAEVLIVDSSPDDQTVQAINAFAKTTRQSIRILRQSKKTFAGKARNIGARAANTEWLLFVDSGITLDADWIVKANQTLDADVIWGQLVFDPQTTFERCYLRSFYRHDFSRRNTNNFMIKKQVFEALGGFIETVHSGEDLALFKKLDGLALREVTPDMTAHYWHFPDSTMAMMRKWISFTADNVVIGQAKAKFVFVGFELLTLTIVGILLWLSPLIGALALAGWLLVRYLYQGIKAKRPFETWIEIPLTLWLILVFDLTRLIGLSIGIIRLIKKNGERL